MTTTLRPILLKAVALLLGGTGLAAWAADHRFALGFLLSGLLMTGSLGLGWFLTRNPDRPLTALASLKLPVLGLGIWTLLQRFDVLAVVLGGSVLIAAIVLHAAVTPAELADSSPRKD